MEDKRLVAFGRLLEVMDRLRAECPWDREQTFESLRNCTIEETYELADAITTMDYDDIRQELGDVLLHVVFYSKMADEQGRFDIADVITFLCDKLIYRHPHVYGDTEADDAVKVKSNWEQLKLKEKKRKKGVLGGVPVSLPAMVKAYRIGEKAAATGFDWEKPQDVWDKVREELEEVNETLDTNASAADREEEFGDLFFALVNAARLYGVDPEMALERSNKKFISRFNHIEASAEKQGRQLRELGLEEMDRLWNEAKINERK